MASAGSLSRPGEQPMDAAPARGRPAPGPRFRTPFGFMSIMRRDPLGFMLECLRDHGDVVHVRFPPWSMVLLANPRDVRHVLQDNHKNYWKGNLMGKLKRVAGEGLVFSDGDLWRRQRQLAQPAFHRQRIAALADMMTATTSEMLARWDAPHGASRTGRRRRGDVAPDARDRHARDVRCGSRRRRGRVLPRRHRRHGVRESPDEPHLHAAAVRPDAGEPRRPARDRRPRPDRVEGDRAPPAGEPGSRRSPDDAARRDGRPPAPRRGRDVPGRRSRDHGDVAGVGVAPGLGPSRRRATAARRGRRGARTAARRRSTISRRCPTRA